MFPSRVGIGRNGAGGRSYPTTSSAAAAGTGGSGSGSGSGTSRSSLICQRCLAKGHATYECTRPASERPYVSRPTRSQALADPKAAKRLALKGVGREGESWSSIEQRERGGEGDGRRRVRE